MAVGGGGMRANLSSAEILGAQKTAPLFVCSFQLFLFVCPEPVWAKRIVYLHDSSLTVLFHVFSVDTRAAEGDAAGSWRPMPSMQTPRHAFALAAMMHTAVDDAGGDNGGRDRGKPALYATGGWMYGSCCTGSVERYVEGASEWEPCASLRTPRRLHGAAALGNRLYVFGGSPGNGAVDAKVKVSRRRRTTRKKDRKLDAFPLFFGMPRQISGQY
jgi:hypothetical protein